MAKKKKDHYIDPQQRELHELIELKKMQRAAAEHQDIEPLFEPEERIVPKTFKEKWKNYWYHYKTTTWISVFVVILVAWLIKDIFFGQKYDLTVAAASKYSFNAVNENLATDMAKYVTDYNGDGDVNVLYDEMTLDYNPDNNIDPQMNMINMQKFMAVMASGEELIFIMDQDVYDNMIENSGADLFADLSALYPDQTDKIKGDKLILNNTRLGKRMGVNNLKDQEVFLCVRALGGTADGSKKKIAAAYQNSFDFVHNIMIEEYPVLKDTKTPLPEGTPAAE